MPRDRTLTPDSLNQLLVWLGGDHDAGALKYEDVRRRLMHFFAARGCSEADTLADETIDRVSAKVSALVDGYDGDPAWYFLGVARNVFLEWTRDAARWAEATENAVAGISVDNESDDLACLDECLAGLPQDARELIMAYYTFDDAGHIDVRKDLADDLGISVGALHIRASRIRAKLGECVGDCMNGTQGKVS